LVAGAPMIAGQRPVHEARCAALLKAVMPAPDA
jgi:hypothetical protein